MTDISALHLTVPRTARYYQIGTPGALVRDVWIACHGYGQLGASFVKPFAQMGDDTRLIVVPEALSRFYLASPAGGGHATVPVGASWMTRDDREMDIVDIVAYLDTLVERLFDSLAPYGISSADVRLHALGFSQGAPAAARWVARGAWAVDHLVLWGGEIPADVNLRAVAERKTGFAVDMVYGIRDETLDDAKRAAQEQLLVASGVPYQVRTFDGGHALKRTLLRTLMTV